MNVRLAAQTFSNSVADALNWLEFDLKEAEFAGASATATFCRMINGMFDLLNSRNKFVKDPCKAPISKDNINLMRQNVAEYTAYIHRLQVYDPKIGHCVPVTSSARRTGFVGMLISMASAIGVYERIEKPDLGMEYLLTYKMSQDHLETFLSALRKQGGFNNNPSAFQFQASYKRLLVHHEITGSQYADCVAVDSTRILHVDSSTEALSSNLTSEKVQFNEIVDHDYCKLLFYCDNAAVNDIIAYIAGFVVNKIEKVIDCDQCRTLLSFSSGAFIKIAHRCF